MNKPAVLADIFLDEASDTEDYDVVLQRKIHFIRKQIIDIKKMDEPDLEALVTYKVLLSNCKTTLLRLKEEQEIPKR